MKNYRGKISYLLPMLIVPVLFTAGVILNREFNSQSLMLLCLAWIFSLVLLLLPLLYKLEVGENFIRKSFLGIITAEFSPDKVESVSYGGIALWNGIYPNRSVVHGKGLAILVNMKGVRKVYGFSEKLYGKEAIESLNYKIKK